MKPVRTPLSSIVHAFSIAMKEMALDLEKAGVFSASEFADRLRQQIDTADQTRPIDEERLDLIIGRAIADRVHPPSAPSGRWTPELIQGGLAGLDD